MVRRESPSMPDPSAVHSAEGAARFSRIASSERGGSETGLGAGSSRRLIHRDSNGRLIWRIER